MFYYLFPFEKIPKNSRIVLYGAGNVGKQFRDQVLQTNFCEIVLWLDKKADDILIKSPENISSLNVDNYDFVIIAIEDETIANDVKKFLENYEIPEKKIIHYIAQHLNIPRYEYPVELNDEEIKLIKYVLDNGLSMVSKEGLFATMMSCKYVIANNIDGDFVECGVWRGGNSIIAAWMFKLYNSQRKVYLYDTFDGMTEPTEFDFTLTSGEKAKKFLEKSVKNESNYIWCYSSIDDVKNNFSKLGLLSENVIFVQGDVLQTLEQNNIPEKIAVLRLDTDWYESTKKEMEILYPRINSCGVLIIDDYGTWGGSKKAVDEFFEKDGYRPFLQYIDHTGRIGTVCKI